jgi:hypothetical protein
MKQIIENFRQFIKEADNREVPAMDGGDPLYPKITSQIGHLQGFENIIVMVDISGDTVMVTYTDPKGGLPLKQLDQQNDPPMGSITMRKTKNTKGGDGSCVGADKDLEKSKGAWVVSIVDSNMGPLLYDVAMEIACLDLTAPSWAKQFGTSGHVGLTSDRTSVTGGAFDVWQKFYSQRPDIKKVQLDDLENTLTPTDSDNCDSDSAKLHPPYPHPFAVKGPEDEEKLKADSAENLKKSPLMKVYVKDNARTLMSLKAIGRLGIRA